MRLYRRPSALPGSRPRERLRGHCKIRRRTSGSENLMLTTRRSRARRDADVYKYRTAAIWSHRGRPCYFYHLHAAPSILRRPRHPIHRRHGARRARAARELGVHPIHADVSKETDVQRTSSFAYSTGADVGLSHTLHGRRLGAMQRRFCRSDTAGRRFRRSRFDCRGRR